MTQLRIRSSYLRDRLRVEPPSDVNLDTYADLLQLERLLVERPKKWMAGMAYQALRSKYPEAFASIASEIAPDLYQEHLGRERRLRRDLESVSRQREDARRRLLRDLQQATIAIKRSK